MVLEILLLITILLQLIAVVTAIRLMRMTKYSVSWMFFTAALIALSCARLGEYYQTVADKELRLPPDFFVWLGVFTSLCIVVGLFYVKKIFNYISRLDHKRKLTNKRILNTVLRTEEKERMRFSKELHDGLGPLLSSAKMSLSALDKTDQPEGNKEIIGNVSYVIEEAIRSLREISNNLSPQLLKDFGLVRAVNNFITKALSLNNIKINFDTNLKAERFDTDVEVILYRVICELINNSIKHSGATQMDISLIFNEPEISIRYSDNGKGFNPEAVKDVGMGLSNIYSRISSLKGKVQIVSSRGNGMKAQINVNLDNTISLIKQGRNK